ncbi:MAG TPA: hypothetical protein VF719_05990 [Abditibacteriaceae bacterium]
MLSVVAVSVGFVVMFAILPLRAYESHTPKFYYENYGAARLAGLYVFALIGVFCSLNADRNQNVTQTAKQHILIWNLVLGIWTSVLFIFLIVWWQKLDSFLKPSWFQGG